MNKIVETLLEQFRQQVGEDVQPTSILELDFNYKTVFAEHIREMHQIAKQHVLQEQTRKEEQQLMREQLAQKDKEIEEIIENY